MQPTITFFLVPIVDFSISTNTEFTNSGSFPSFKSLRNLYCITLWRYKQTPSSSFLETKVLLYIVIRNIIVNMEWFDRSLRDGYYFQLNIQVIQYEVSCKK